MNTILLIIATVIITVMALWAYFTAQRLNTLHIRTDAALAQLQAVLDRRAAVIGVLIPTIAATATKAEGVPLRHGLFDERSQRERELNQAVHNFLEADSELGADSGSEKECSISANPQLVDAETRVQLAHRFYNEAVSDTRGLRLRPAVRVLRLGGTAPLPEFFEYSFKLDQS